MYNYHRTMEVKNIQKYSFNQTFHALRFKKNAEYYIKSMPKPASDKLEEISKKLENTTFYHLEISKNEYYICHNDGEKYFLPINLINAGKAIIVKAKQGLSQISLKLKYNTTNEVKDIIAKTKSVKTQIERISEIVKILDNYEKEYR